MMKYEFKKQKLQVHFTQATLERTFRTNKFDLKAEIDPCRKQHPK